MKKRWTALILGGLLLLSGCGGGKMTISDFEGASAKVSKNINQIDKMPDRPDSYVYTDYRKIARDLDAVLFDFAKDPDFAETDWVSENPTYAPVGYWIPEVKNKYYEGRAFGVPSYLGHVDDSGNGTIGINGGGSPEGVTTLAAVYGAMLSGIDKTAQTFTGADGTVYTYDFVDMLKSFYSSEGFILNRMNGTTGASFWYELYPQILYARIHNLAGLTDADARAIILEGADKWAEALDYFYDDGLGRFAWTSFDFFSMRPTLSRWVEPPNPGAAFILLNAFNLTGKQGYLDAAREYVDYCEQEMKNQNYEILIDYLGYCAAYMNFAHGTRYNVQKFVNNIFDSEDDYRPSGVVNGKWGDYDAYGLMAYDNWGNNYESAYAFAMNTFHIGSTLAPLLRYDARFADDVGKWFLHAVNSARLFYNFTLPADQQSQYGVSAAADPNGALAYEGVRRNYAGKSPYAMGDPTVYGWGKTDFGIYGSAHAGIFGGLVRQTEIEQILRIDLTRADDFGAAGDFQHYLYYNPYGEEKTLTVDFGRDVCLFDTVTNRVLVPRTEGAAEIVLPASGSVILAVLPADGERTEEGGMLFVDGIPLVRTDRCAVNIENLTVPKTVVPADSPTRVEFSFDLQEGDPVTGMTLSFNGKTLYEGERLDVFEFQPPAQEDWLFVPGSHLEGGRNWDVTPVQFINQFYEGELKVEIQTQSGSWDTAVIRLRRA